MRKMAPILALTVLVSLAGCARGSLAPNTVPAKGTLTEAAKAAIPKPEDPTISFFAPSESRRAYWTQDFPSDPSDPVNVEVFRRLKGAGFTDEAIAQVTAFCNADPGVNGTEDCSANGTGQFVDPCDESQAVFGFGANLNITPQGTAIVTGNANLTIQSPGPVRNLNGQVDFVQCFELGGDRPGQFAVFRGDINAGAPGAADGPGHFCAVALDRGNPPNDDDFVLYIGHLDDGSFVVVGGNPNGNTTVN